MSNYYLPLNSLTDVTIQSTPPSSNATLPVLIFLYGGGFGSGANGMPAYSGVNFVSAQKDVIFASIKSVFLPFFPCRSHELIFPATA
jgi:hypothetical protein